MIQLSDIECSARKIAMKAGGILMSYFQNKQSIWAKPTYEIVSEADYASEETIISHIKRTYPDHVIVSEESGTVPGDDKECVWIVDPLDGTMKFVLGEVYFSISIAFEYKGTIEIGVIYNPATKDFYIARRGEGSHKNGVVLRVSSNDKLTGSFVCCDWGYSASMQKKGLFYLSRLLPPTTRGVSINFSPALDLCNLAEGFITAMISNGTTPQDHSAGGLIVKEAGGSIISFGRSDWSHQNEGIIATNSPSTQAQIIKLLEN